VVFISANPFVSSNRVFLLITSFVLLFFFLKRRLRLDPQIFILLAITLLITLFQGILWNFSLFTFTTFFILAILTPYFSIKILGINYLRITSKIVFYSAIISLILYSGQIFIPGFTNTLFLIESFIKSYNSVPERPSLLIYSIAHNTIDRGEISDFLRNPGMFHEPGAFAVFLVLALVINIFIENKPFTIKNLILIIALITTFSTAGYLSAIIVFLLYYIIIKGKKVFVLFISLVILIPGTLYIFRLPFMSEKIKLELQDQSNKNLNEETSGRIFGARKAIIVLTRYPFFGRGLTKPSRETDLSSDEAAGYGFMNFFSQIGIIASIFYLFYFVKGLKRINLNLSSKPTFLILLLSSLMINLFSQHFISTPFFTMVLFIGLLKEFALDKKAIYQLQL
jgi:hypothetical protein